MVWFSYLPTWRLLTLPLFILLAIVAALGPGLIMTALTVRYRDFRFLVPFIVQFGLYVSPVAYSSSVVREKLGERWFILYSMNPMVGVIEGFRWAILGGAGNFLTPAFILSLLLTILLFFAGIFYFRKTERIFADVI
jgi:lipopolysaccharide transport system permease protein